MRTILMTGVCIAVGSAIFASGCSSEPRRQAVSGTVTFQGRPLESGSIEFSPEADGKGSIGGAVVSKGKYEIPAAQGLLPGRYKVSVSAAGGKAEPGPDDAPGENKPQKELIPEKYNAATELRADVTSGGANQFPFDLK